LAGKRKTDVLKSGSVSDICLSGEASNVFQSRPEGRTCRATGASDEPTEATTFDSTAWAAHVFGGRTKAAMTAAKARGTKLGGNRGVKPIVKMRTNSAAARQQRASAKPVELKVCGYDLVATGDGASRRPRSRSGSASADGELEPPLTSGSTRPVLGAAPEGVSPAACRNASLVTDQSATFSTSVHGRTNRRRQAAE
jgi:hypothetical protein